MDPIEGLLYFALACAFVLWTAVIVIYVTGVITG